MAAGPPSRTNFDMNAVANVDLELQGSAAGFECQVSDGELRTSRTETDIAETGANIDGGDVQPLPSRRHMFGLSSSDIRSCILVLCAFTIVFTACGITFVFGVYQALYESLSFTPNTPFTGASTASIDLIGTIAISLMSLLAPFATAWTKRFPPRLVILCGAAIFGLANLLASYSQKLWQFELTQGVLLGVGTCLTYIPAATVVPTWFNKRRGLAMGIVISGTGVGGVVFAPAVRALNESVGFRNTLRINAGIAWVLLSLSAFAIDWDRRPGSVMARVLEAEAQARMQQQTHRRHGCAGILQEWASIWRHVPLVNWRIARSRKFVAQALAAAFQAAAYYTPMFFFASYARTLGYSVSDGANFIALSNAMNAVGKIVIGHVADRLGRVNTLCATTVVTAIVCLGLWLPSTEGSSTGEEKNLFIAFTVLYGIFASAYISLFPTSLVELFGVAHYASVNGFLYMVRGMASLVGTPVAGLLIRGRHQDSEARSPSSFEVTSIMVGVLMALAAVTAIWVRLEATGMLGAAAKWKL